MSRVVIMRFLAFVALVVGVSVFAWEGDWFFLFAGAFLAFVLWPFRGKRRGGRGESAAAYDYDHDWDGGGNGGGDGGGNGGGGD